MFSEIDQDQFTENDITGYLISYDCPFVGPLYNLWDWFKPDLFISFGDAKLFDKKRSTVYHEMTHVSQYAMAGPAWWEEYVRYIIGVSFTNQPGPYGDGSSQGAGMAELAEGMAYAHEWVIADQKYELEHSNGGIDPQIRRYFSLAEDLLYKEPSTNFIPSGLFFDLYDEYGVFPPVFPALTELSFIFDQTKGFPFETQVQVLSLPSVFDIASFKSALWQFHGSASGSMLINYNGLFLSYGH